MTTMIGIPRELQLFTIRLQTNAADRSAKNTPKKVLDANSVPVFYAGRQSFADWRFGINHLSVQSQ
jgi:hypothetical protein